MISSLLLGAPQRVEGQVIAGVRVDATQLSEADPQPEHEDVHAMRHGPSQDEGTRHDLRWTG